MIPRPPANPSDLHNGALWFHAMETHIQELGYRASILVDALVRGGAGWHGLGGKAFETYWVQVETHQRQVTEALADLANTLQSYAVDFARLETSKLAQDFGSALAEGYQFQHYPSQAELDYHVEPAEWTNEAYELLGLYYSMMKTITVQLDWIAEKGTTFFKIP